MRARTILPASARASGEAGGSSYSLRQWYPTYYSLRLMSADLSMGNSTINIHIYSVKIEDKLWKHAAKAMPPRDYRVLKSTDLSSKSSVNSVAKSCFAQLS